jgi:TetR/AcrR family transcriptional regulator, copper-responsive repressor
MTIMETQTPTRGRPRAFDRDAALNTAMRLFWDRGYDGTSMADLTAALHIAPPSLYAAFGDKRRLFLHSLERYAADHGCFLPHALQQGTTAREAIAAMLHAATLSYTQDDCPKGCMVIAASTGDASALAEVAADLATRRAASHTLILARLDKGVADGDLPPDTATADLADYFAAVIYGLSVSARTGVGRAALQSIADRAMAAFPA